jgi:hypothetical protein
MASSTFAKRGGTIAARARRALKVGVHVLGHVATTVIGLVLVVVGLGLTMTVVFVTAGILSLAIGVALIVGGIFAPAGRPVGTSSEKPLGFEEEAAEARRPLHSNRDDQGEHGRPPLSNG